MSPTRRLLIGGIVLFTAATGYVAGRALFRPAWRVTQPVSFSHALHVTDLEIECETCHQYVRTGRHAGLPELSLCLECHEEALTESPEERRLIEMAGTDHPPSFRKLFRIADHTLYSHARHVGDASLECDTCHGAIAETAEPPETPLVRVSMDLCVDCHRTNGVSTDCTHCHR